MKIQIEPYNKDWRHQFLEIKKILNNVLENVQIEHIGSTAVQGLMSKAIIDILIGIEDTAQLDDFIDPVVQSNFVYISAYEDEIPNRRFFIKDKNEKRTHHIHLVKKNTNWYRRHLAFRDELRNNRKVKSVYQSLKLSLSKKDWNNTNEYSDAKTDFIRSIEKRILNGY